MSITLGDLIVLAYLLSGFLALCIVGSLIGRMIGRVADQYPEPETSHVRLGEVCAGCDEPKPHLVPFSTSLLLDPEPMCRGCIEESRHEDSEGVPA